MLTLDPLNCVFLREFWKFWLGENDKSSQSLKELQLAWERALTANSASSVHKLTLCV